MMLDRRRFLTRSAALGGTLGMVLPTLANPGANELRQSEPYANLVTSEADEAIRKGLKFLASTQLRDGSFGDSLIYAGNVAVTALAGLALMAGGHAPGRGAYGDNVKRALEYLISKEQKCESGPGFFTNGGERTSQWGMYNHGFATLFMCEAYGMVPEPALQLKLKGCIERAVQIIIKSQNSEGGWRYLPTKQQGDSSVTICQIMALRAARNVGFFVPKEVADKCVKYVRSCQTAEGGFSYFAGNGPPAFARSAAGVVALYCAGVYTGPEVERGLRYLMRFKPGENIGNRTFLQDYYYYGHYYAAQAMWTAGPKYWNDWFPAIRDELLKLNRNRPDGSWLDPTVCSHYGTAMACIILQIPNNYLPILQK